MIKLISILFISTIFANVTNNGATLTINEGVSVVVNGDFTNNGTVNNQGSLNINGSYLGEGSFDNNGVFLTNELSESSTLYVPANFSTIQSAIDYSTDGDTVLVSAGTYYENIQINKDITLLSISGRDYTFIDGSNNNSVIKVYSSCDIEGFTIQNGNSEKGAGIKNGSEPTEGYGNVNLKDMIFTNNYSSTKGSAIYYYTDQNSTINNVIVKNNENGSANGSAIYVAFNSTNFNGCEISYNQGNGVVLEYANSHFNNCTISENIGYGVKIYFGGVYFFNSILYGDSYGEIYNSGSFSAHYCNIQNIPANTSAGSSFYNCIDSLPMFVNQPNGDYSLQSTSPCIDAGDPNSELDPDGTRADIGAYYFHQNLGCMDTDALN